ncbi:MAG: ribonuclease PH [Bacillota bacterium]|jgi:ribonuclease PH
MRLDNCFIRNEDEMRPVTIEKGFMPYAEGSALITCGNTKVICAATVEAGTPKFMEDDEGGWLTAEYSMLPRATQTRNSRPIGKVNGRSQEIQRLIGRSLRAAVDLPNLGPYTIKVDCDVMQADGGTRTASITGAYVAVVEALKYMQKNGMLPVNFSEKLPLRGQVAAVSVGIVKGVPCLDLCYEEDSSADVDMNVILLCKEGEFESHIIEIQGTAERESFSRSELNILLDLAECGIGKLYDLQNEVLK